MKRSLLVLCCLLQAGVSLSARGHNMPALDFYREKAQQRMHSVPCMSAKDFFDHVQKPQSGKVQAGIGASLHWALQQELMQAVVDGAQRGVCDQQARAALVDAITQYYAQHPYPLAQFFVELFKELESLGVTAQQLADASGPTATLISDGQATKLLDVQLLHRFLQVSYVLLFGQDAQLMASGQIGFQECGD